MRFIQQDKNGDVASYMDSHWCSHPTLASQPLWTGLCGCDIGWEVKVTCLPGDCSNTKCDCESLICFLYLGLSSRPRPRPQGPKAPRPQGSARFTSLNCSSLLNPPARVILRMPGKVHVSKLRDSKDSRKLLQTPSNVFKHLIAYSNIFKHKENMQIIART